MQGYKIRIHKGTAKEICDKIEKHAEKIDYRIVRHKISDDIHEIHIAPKFDRAADCFISIPWHEFLELPVSESIEAWAKRTCNIIYIDENPDLTDEQIRKVTGNKTSFQDFLRRRKHMAGLPDIMYGEPGETVEEIESRYAGQRRGKPYKPNQKETTMKKVTVAKAIKDEEGNLTDVENVKEYRNIKKTQAVFRYMKENKIEDPDEIVYYESYESWSDSE
jgi:hypothetical protein